MEIELLNFNIHGDNRGSLVALESMKNIPFDIKRIYYIYETLPDVVRGQHAHRNLQQVAVVLAGSCRFILDDGCEKNSIILSKPSEGLVIPRMIWRDMDQFTEDCVLLVLASEKYDESDYIRSYEEFIKIVDKNA